MNVYILYFNFSAERNKPLEDLLKKENVSFTIIDNSDKWRFIYKDSLLISPFPGSDTMKICYELYLFEGFFTKEQVLEIIKNPSTIDMLDVLE